MEQLNLNQIVEDIPPHIQEKLLNLIKEEVRYKETHAIEGYFPDVGDYSRDKYPKHIKFIEATNRYSQVAIIAGNQVGKTLLCSYVLSVLLTGRYPYWWTGKKFLRPIRAWAVSVTGNKNRDNIQKYLLGPFFNTGTGMIPKEDILETKSSSQVSGLYTDIIIKHRTNGQIDGKSWLSFKAYSDEREKFQGEQVDLIWFDEEDKNQKGIYRESLARGLSGNIDRLIICSFTPLYGMSDMITSFIPKLEFPEEGYGESRNDDPDKYVVNVTWDDVPHMNEKAKKELERECDNQEFLARSRGIPGLGAGLIYPVDLSTLMYSETKGYKDYLDTLPHTYAMDIAYTAGGITAALWAAYDESNDCWWIRDEYLSKGASKADHALAINSRGKWMAGIIDPASERSNSIDDNKKIVQSYKDLGLTVRHYSRETNALEAGIQEALQRMLSGRLRINDRCQFTKAHLRLYRRDPDFKIIKKDTHLPDCLRYICMSGKRTLRHNPKYYEEEDFEKAIWNRPITSRNPYTGY